MADPSIGGAILGEACHFVDLMQWLLDSEPVSVSAYSRPTGHGPIGENNLAASFHFRMARSAISRQKPQHLPRIPGIEHFVSVPPAVAGQIETEVRRDPPPDWRQFDAATTSASDENGRR